MEGTVKFFNDSKGWGFISGQDGQDYFVHHSNIDAEGFRTLAEGQPVSFDSATTPQGLHATNVQPS